MGSITPERAALFAALAMVLLCGSYLVDNAALIPDHPYLVLLGSVFPGLVWAGFFLVVGRSLDRVAAWTALIFAVVLESVVAYLRFQESVAYWTPFGSAISLVGWILRIGWAAFLIAFAIAPHRRITRTIALLLAIVSAPTALSTTYGAWNNWIGLFLGDIPTQVSRVLILPAIRTIFWVSQILFLWTISKSGENSLD